MSPRHLVGCLGLNVRFKEVFRPVAEFAACPSLFFTAVGSQFEEPSADSTTSNPSDREAKDSEFSRLPSSEIQQLQAWINRLTVSDSPNSRESAIRA